jgi:hypothetical protein
MLDRRGRLYSGGIKLQLVDPRSLVLTYQADVNAILAYMAWLGRS